MERENGDLEERYEIKQANGIIAAADGLIDCLFAKANAQKVVDAYRDFYNFGDKKISSLQNLPPFLFKQPQFDDQLNSTVRTGHIDSCTLQANIQPYYPQGLERDKEEFVISFYGRANDIGGSRNFTYAFDFRYFPNIDASNIADFEESLTVEILLSPSDWEDVLVPVEDKLQFTGLFLYGLAQAEEIKAAPGCLSFLPSLLKRVIGR